MPMRTLGARLTRAEAVTSPVRKARGGIWYGFSMLLRWIVALCLTTSGALAQDRLNVLFIASDDMNNDLGTYGHPVVKTPNFDRLARLGIRFDRAYCNYPVCNPSRASLMTGLYPDQTGVRNNALYFRDTIPNVKTLPQMFRENGYFVARIGKIYHYGVPTQIGEDGLDDPASWEETVNPRGRDKWEEDRVYTIDSVTGNLGGTLSWMAQDGIDEEQTDGIGTTAAIQILEQSRERPFFLAMGFYRPHTPYVAPKKYFFRYPLRLIRLPAEPLDDLVDIPPAAWVDRPYQLNLPRRRQREAIRAYYASISFVDAQLGRLIDALERLDLVDSTLIVFWSDHGYHMGEHKLWQKTTLFENSARVPFFIASPAHRRTAGLSTSSLAELVDIYPTLADLCSMDAPRHLVGRSLVPILEDPTQSVRDSALTTFDTHDRVNPRRPLRPRAVGYTVRTQRWRYTEWGEDGEQGRELYDHWNDPKEFVNLALAPSERETVNRMKRLLRERVAHATSPPRL